MNDAEKTRTKSCRACRRPINSLATKCHHCEAFQDWRHIGSGLVPVGSLLIAVMSLSITAFALWPTISEQVWPKRVIVLADYDTDDNSIDLKIGLVNLSTIPVHIQKYIRCPHREEGIVFLETEQSFSIKPHETVDMVFHVDLIGSHTPKAPKDGLFVCTITGVDPIGHINLVEVGLARIADEQFAWRYLHYKPGNGN